MLDTGALDRGQSINSCMHAAALSEHQTAFRTHLHDITSNHINASGLISQPAASFWHPDKIVLEAATLFAAVCVDLTRAERELFHLNVRSRLRAVGQRLLSL